MFWIIVSSVLLGVAITLAVQAYFIRKYYSSLPKLDPPFREQIKRFALPKALRDLLEEMDIRNRKEMPLCLNLIFQFLFRELKDAPSVRKWLSEKMNAEFEELLQTTTGKLVDTITVRDFSVGESFPVVKSANVRSVVPHHDHLSLDELEVLIDIDYHGGFQLSVDVDLVFGKSAYLSVTMTHLQGSARIQLSRLPFTHWSFAFMEDPTIDFEVESQFEGRPMPQITSLIINQIRRTIRKKHTLPNYKIRFKPFFSKPDPPDAVRALYLHGKKLTVGHLEVTVLECGRLQQVAADCSVFCTLSLDQLPWKQLMQNRRKRWTSHDIDMTKSQSQSLGLLFREEFMLDRYESVVLVEMVNPESPAAEVDIRKNDIVVAVNGIRVTTMKQAVKLIKQAGEKFSVRLERANSKPQEQFNYDERTVFMRSDNFDLDDETVEDEEFINISLSGNSLRNSTNGSTPDGNQATPESPTGGTQPKQGKAFALLQAGSQFLQRRRSRDERSTSPSPRDSPEPTRRQLVNMMLKPLERRTHSDGEIDVPSTSLLGQEMAAKDDSPLKEIDIDPLPVHSSVSAAQLSQKNNSSTSTTPQRTASNSQPQNTSASLPTTKSESLMSDESAPFDVRSFGLLKTALVPASVEPFWDESFTFDVEEQHDYLNVCVWCRTPEKLDKQSRVIKPEKDVLIGYVSVNLMRVVSECMMTLQCDTQQTHTLNPPDLKPGAARTKSPLATHSGYDDKLAHGDLTLVFRYSPQSAAFPPREPRTREQSPVKFSKREGSLPVNDNGTEGGKMPKTSLSGPSKQLEEGRHDFLGTQFHSATFCRFCGKKIWLKVAFQCRICAMICHKKCTEKCQAQTTCTKEGPIPRPVNPSEPTEILNKDVPKSTPAIGDKPTIGPLSKSAALLQRLTKRESPKIVRRDIEMSNISDSAKSTPTHTLHLPDSGVQDRRRHNSAPDNEGASLEVLVTRDDQCLPSVTKLEVPELPRTRSSASLEDLMKENVGSLKPDENLLRACMPSSGESSDEDEERQILKMMRQYQSKTHEQDELVVTAAKQMGKELYMDLSLEERRDKLDLMVTKFQRGIDQESEYRAELARLERGVTDLQQKTKIRENIQKSDEKIQAVAVMMLHYCAGLQHCLDQMEEEKTKIKVTDEEGQGQTEESQGQTEEVTVDDDSK